MTKIGKNTLSPYCKPYIIAEVGVNHEGNIKKAMLMIDQAKQSGASAVKFQSYKADTLASKNSPSYWDLTKEKTNSQYLLFKKYDQFNVKDYLTLANYCKKRKIDFMSTPFDNSSVDFLNPLVNTYKVASADITNFPLLKKIASKKKPIILSTGASSKKEINATIKYLNKNGVINKNIILLHCILNYPTQNVNANLMMIVDLIKSYPKHIIGYSDHTLPNENMTSTTLAYSLGAVVIEKHFTFNKKLPGNDHYHSMDSNDLKEMSKSIEDVRILLGKNKYKKAISSEKIAIRNARRSIFYNEDLKKGNIISAKTIVPKRPGNGISPVEFNKIIGKRLKRDVKEDQQVKWSDF